MSAAIRLGRLLAELSKARHDSACGRYDHLPQGVVPPVREPVTTTTTTTKEVRGAYALVLIFMRRGDRDTAMAFADTASTFARQAGTGAAKAFAAAARAATLADVDPDHHDQARVMEITACKLMKEEG